MENNFDKVLFPIPKQLSNAGRMTCIDDYRNGGRDSFMVNDESRDSNVGRQT